MAAKRPAAVFEWYACMRAITSVWPCNPTCAALLSANLRVWWDLDAVALLHDQSPACLGLDVLYIYSSVDVWC